MVTTAHIPSLIGFRPEEAEEAAAAVGVTVIWTEDEPPKWLPARHEPRVGRQRLRDEHTLELLRVLVPVVRGPNEDTAEAPPQP